MMKSGKFAAVFAAFALGLGSAVHAAPPPQQQTVAAATGSVAPELDVIRRSAETYGKYLVVVLIGQ